MFQDFISDTEFVGPVADGMFPGIRRANTRIMGAEVPVDATLLSTFRALVWPILPDGTTLTLVCMRGTGTEVLDVRDGVESATDMVKFVSLCGSESDVGKHLADISREMNSRGFRAHRDFELFVRKQNIEARCYTNDKTRVTYVVAPAMFGSSLRLFHYLLSMLPRYCMWYFNGTRVLQDEESVAVLRALCQKTPDEYLRAIAKIAERYDFQGAKIKTLLGGIEESMRHSQIENLETELQRLNHETNDVLARYRELVDECREMNIRLLGLRAAPTESSGVVDFFLANPSLRLETADKDGHIDFVVMTYMENFDKDAYDRLITTSYVQRVISSSKGISDADDMKLLLDAIFADEPVIKLKFCAYYSIKIGGHVSTTSGYVYPEYCVDMMPNPHLQYYACLGGYIPHIEEALRRGDVVDAVAECMASAKSINVPEGATFVPFLKDLAKSSCRKIIELPDGTSCTPKEAIEWLKQNRNGGGTGVSAADIELSMEEE